MLLRTHLAVNTLFGLLLLSYMPNKALFIILLILATLLPDIDTLHSYVSRRTKPLSTIINFFSKHRGFFHSLTCSIIISIFLVLLSPSVAFPFFVGYSMHIFADSFTREGIEILWPLKKKLQGNVRTGGLAEKVIFVIFIAIDLLYLAYLLQ